MRSRAGFTLLELLVALALLAVIGAGLASAMRLGAETYQRAQALGTDSGHVAARAQLRRLLTRATSPGLLTPFPKEFRGEQSSLSFVTLAPLGFARDAAGLKITISMIDETLTALIEPFDDEGVTLRSYLAPLANDVQSVQLSYFADGAWHPSWNETATLPKLVRIALNDGTRPIWPEFTVEMIYAD